MSKLGMARSAIGIVSGTLLVFSAAAHALFGWSAMAEALARDLNPHFLLFIATGALLALFAFTRRA